MADLERLTGSLTAGQKNVGAAELHALVEGLGVKTTFLTGKGTLTAYGSSVLLLVYDPSSGLFKKGTLPNVIFQNSQLIADRSESTTPANTLMLLALDPGGPTFYKVSRANLFYQWFNEISFKDDLTSESSPAGADVIAVQRDSDGAYRKVPWSSITRASYVKCADQKSSGTDGGTFSAGSWQKRDLAEITDPDGVCAVASSQITLDAGTYECRISCPAYRVNNHQARLYNTTGAAVLLTGTSERSDFDADESATRSQIVGRFTVAASQALEVQHYCASGRPDVGFGIGFGVTTEVYTIAEFWKVG